MSSFGKDGAQKNLILVVILSFVALAGGDYLIRLMRPDQPQEEEAPASSDHLTSRSSLNERQASRASSGSFPDRTSASGPKQARVQNPGFLTQPVLLKRALSDKDRLHFQTRSLKGSVHLRGGILDDVILTQHRETTAVDSPFVRLLTPRGTDNPYYSDFRWAFPDPEQQTDLDIPTASTVWQGKVLPADAGCLRAVLFWTSAQGVRFEKHIQIDAQGLVKVKGRIISPEPWQDACAQLVWTEEIVRSQPETEGQMLVHEGIVGYLDGSLAEWSYDKVAGRSATDQSLKKGWIGFTDKYWLAALAPRENVRLQVAQLTCTQENASGPLWGAPSQVVRGSKLFVVRMASALRPESDLGQRASGDNTGSGSEAEESDRNQASRQNFSEELNQGPEDAQSGNFEHSPRAPGSAAEAFVLTAPESRLFLGAKHLTVLDAYEVQENIPHFDLALDFGWFYFITKPTFYALSWLNKNLGSMALAILVFTVLLKLIFFPLANKSYRSMARMKQVAPQIEALKAKYKDDAARMGQEVMALYKKEKANPISGCLPMLLNMPFFFALYKILVVSIDMRHAPFWGWIADLSAPDPTNIFTLFGLIPVTLPSFLHLGVWPLLMGIGMYFQQRMSPPPADPTQKNLFLYGMPVMFTFMLGQFSAGAVIYWTWQNLLSLAQQTLIGRLSQKKT